MTRTLNIVLLTMLIFVGLPFYWLLLNATSSGEQAMPVSIAQLRQLAGALPGDAPVSVRYEIIGRRSVMSDLLAAGSGLRPVPFVVYAFELVLPGNRVVTIDRGMPRALAQQEHFSNFDPRAQAAVDSAAAAADVALVLAPRAQHSGVLSAKTGWGSGLKASDEPARKHPYAVAPGVVVIPAHDITHGERMVFVRLANGQELLFAGDIAPLRQSWSQQRPPARLITSHYVARDRERIAAWLRTISRLKASAPALQIVAGHEAALPRTVTRGFIVDPVSAHAKIP